MRWNHPVIETTPGFHKETQQSLCQIGIWGSDLAQTQFGRFNWIRPHAGLLCPGAFWNQDMGLREDQQCWMCLLSWCLGPLARDRHCCFCITYMHSDDTDCLSQHWIHMQSDSQAWDSTPVAQSAPEHQGEAAVATLGVVCGSRMYGLLFVVYSISLCRFTQKQVPLHSMERSWVSMHRICIGWHCVRGWLDPPP